ncbi:LacI family DNA-binding transcriptional regulator [Labrys wisconsinensis]|uniref:LacI family transcriptional regulator n=1 Tax=Labrys wisconsinensis TaxID=425677 RepID=A0ABU0J4C8_9HYPH|nr:substrate-binding domain-containing protein [Labrys wisconsinensis]MDQ0468283.1 LacI family transcriptional regulator [Labrys wisconsinensis]
MNLKELAEHLGLSQTTVSRALNGFPEVGEKTRRRVAEAAREFHYRPNASARKLATGRAGALGIVFSTGRNLLLDPIFTDFLAGVADGSAGSDTDVLVSSPRGDEAETYRRMARAHSVDAVILSSPLVEDARVPLLQRLRLPCVVHGRTRSTAPCAFLDIDNEEAFRNATGMLADLGHRRIGLINGDPGFTFALHRERGWREALAARGLPAPPALARSAPMTEENGYRLARTLFEAAEPPTALICSSIFAALGAMRAARDSGRAIGRDLSLVAHDDGLAAIRPETLTPALTTTFSSIRAAGARIAEIALALAEGADPAALREVWPVDLVFRGSTMPPPRDAA